MKLNILKNLDLQEILSSLRNKNTETTHFRRHLRTAGYLMTHEIISKECSVEKTKVKSPLGTAISYGIKEKILQIMVMRAGEPFADGGVKLLDELNAKRSIGVIDAKRIESSNKAGKEFDIEMNSFKVPKFDKNTVIIVYDPMLGTASTLIEILKILKKQGKPKKIIFCNILAVTYGINKLKKLFPELIVYTLSVDKKLNTNGYIVPGLGDCGDRAFGSY